MTITAMFLYIFFLHFIGDYILQPYKMSLEKAEKNTVLVKHVCIYSCVLFFGMAPFVGLKDSALFSAYNGCLHLLVDYLTSRIIQVNSSGLNLDPDASKPIHKRLQLWGPITLLGFDQLLHQACLIYVFDLLFF